MRRISMAACCAALLLAALAVAFGENGGGVEGPSADRKVIKGFSRPASLRFDGRGSLLVAAEDGVHVVRPDGERLRLLERDGCRAGVAVADRGMIVADARRGCVLHVLPRGDVRVLAEGLAEPVDVGVDRDGGIWAACAGDGTVRRVAEVRSLRRQ